MFIVNSKFCVFTCEILIQITKENGRFIDKTKLKLTLKIDISLNFTFTYP